MTHQERVEKLAEWRSNRKASCTTHWHSHMTKPEKVLARADAEDELAFLSTLGAVWLAEDQRLPLNITISGGTWAERFAALEAEIHAAGFRRIEEK